jgi:hypothetical protein
LFCLFGLFVLFVCLLACNSGGRHDLIWSDSIRSPPVFLLFSIRVVSIWFGLIWSGSVRRKKNQTGYTHTYTHTSIPSPPFLPPPPYIPPTHTPTHTHTPQPTPPILLLSPPSPWSGPHPETPFRARPVPPSSMPPHHHHRTQQSQQRQHQCPRPRQAAVPSIATTSVGPLAARALPPA